jgi:hypothetical protein
LLVCDAPMKRGNSGTNLTIHSGAGPGPGAKLRVLITGAGALPD